MSSIRGLLQPRTLRDQSVFLINNYHNGTDKPSEEHVSKPVGPWVPKIKIIAGKIRESAHGELWLHMATTRPLAVIRGDGADQLGGYKILKT